MRRRSRFRRESRPSVLVAEWQGAPLAFEQLEDLLENIRHSLQPPRADIIDRAARTALRVVELLEEFWESLPPGTAPFVRATERRALSGWPPAVSPQTREELEEEEEDDEDDRHRRRRRRHERHRRRLEERQERREERRERDDDDWDDWDDEEDDWD